MYRLIKSMFSSDIIGIFRISDCANIPLDPDNLDYQTYLAWVAEGNTPDPAE